MRNASLLPSSDRDASVPLPANWLQRPSTPFLIAFLTMIPILIPAVPPLTDVGGHLGRMAVQINAGRPSPLNQWYSFEWTLVPNLGMDIIVQLLSPFMALEAALKFGICAGVFLHVSGLFFLSKSAHGHVSPTVFLAVPLVYAYPFQYGFLNFNLSVAVAICALALWISCARHEKLLMRFTFFSVLAPILWVTHLAGWGIFCIMAGGYELVRNLKTYSMIREAVWRTAAQASCLLTPLFFYIFGLTPLGTGESNASYNIFSKIHYILAIFRDQNQLVDLTSACALVMISYVLLRSRNITKDAGLLTGTILLFVLYWLVPGDLSGTSFVDMRLLPVTISFLLICCRPSSHCTFYKYTAIFLVSMLFFMLRMIANTVYFTQSGAEISKALEVLESAPQGSNMLSFVGIHCLPPPRWSLDRRTHLPGYLIARRQSFSNDQWALSGAHLLTIHNHLAAPLTSDGSQLVSIGNCPDLPLMEKALKRVPEKISYLWVIGEQKIQPSMGWVVMRQSGPSTIYRRRNDE